MVHLSGDGERDIMILITLHDSVWYCMVLQSFCQPFVDCQLMLVFCNVQTVRWRLCS